MSEQRIEKLELTLEAFFTIHINDNDEVRYGMDLVDSIKDLVRQQARDEIKERLRQYKPENGNIITADRRWLEKKLFGEGNK